MNEGYTWVVDIDLEKYFDTVNHDKLMSLVAREVKDKRVLKLIRAYLNLGIMINGVVETDKGCPQGGPLSPLLSNIMLNELDKELENETITERVTNRNSSQVNKKSKGKDKIHYLKEQCVEYGVSLPKITTVNNRMGSAILG